LVVDIVVDMLLPEDCMLQLVGHIPQLVGHIPQPVGHILQLVVHMEVPPNHNCSPVCIYLDSSEKEKLLYNSLFTYNINN
jgi:hypothetical protein